MGLSVAGKRLCRFIARPSLFDYANLPQALFEVHKRPQPDENDLGVYLSFQADWLVRADSGLIGNQFKIAWCRIIETRVSFYGLAHILTCNDSKPTSLM